jgi:hypothetical protein
MLEVKETTTKTAHERYSQACHRNGIISIRSSGNYDWGTKEKESWK